MTKMLRTTLYTGFIRSVCTAALVAGMAVSLPATASAQEAQQAPDAQNAPDAPDAPEIESRSRPPQSRLPSILPKRRSRRSAERCRLPAATLSQNCLGSTRPN